MACALVEGSRRAWLSSSVVRSKGLWGATKSANTAQNTQMAAMSAAIMAIGEVRKLYPTSLSSQRERTCFMETAPPGHGAWAPRPAGG